jgi:CheY-like chemotaxis protein
VNLATNARDAMPNGGCVSLSLAPCPAEQIRDGQPQALLQVRDDGMGIAPEILPRVFEPFFTTKELGRGTGLGLAVSHGIVVQAGGQISLQSVPGKGTTVSVQLPLTEPAPQPQLTPEEQAGSARPGERVLLADDDDFVRVVTKRMLAKLGWQVDDVRDGLEAVVRMAASPALYAAAVFDLRMPRMGGEEAAQQVRALAPGLPIIFISGYVDEELPLERVVQKPFDGPALGGHLRRAIDAKLAGAA